MPRSRQTIRHAHAIAFSLALLSLSGCATTRDLLGFEEEEKTTIHDDVAADDLDPLEPFNRPVHRFNMTVDRYLFKPIAQAYVAITPQVVRRGVSNFYSNLQQPISALNFALQGNMDDTAHALGRFAYNTTVGVVGIMDPATKAGLEDKPQDFGQTFSYWGWKDSSYLVLPFFGPGTIRDASGKMIYNGMSPISHLAAKHGAGVTFLYAADTRASFLSVDAFLEGAEDDYMLIRDAYLQRRYCEVHDCSEELPDYLSPDYQYELPPMELGGDSN